MSRFLLFLSLLIAAVPAVAQSPAPSAGARPLFVILYRPGPAWMAGRPMREQNLRPHGAYYAGLLRDGRVFAGGGFDGDGGMAIIRAADAAEARAILAADPAITSGVFVAELRQWIPRFVSPGPLVETAR
jgi:uncharacterized protein YciI